MNMLKLTKTAALAALVTAGVVPAVQAEETPWHNHGQEVSSRLISAVDGKPTTDQVLIGLELKVQPGWKTYWRSPGEAGLPPVVSQADGSKDGIRMLYPLPTRFELFGLQTYGYSSQVIFPVYVDRDQFRDNTVDLKASFMVCKDICIPYNVQHSLNLGEGEERPAIQRMALDYAMEQVPHLEGDAGAGLEIVQTKIQGKMGHERLLVEVRTDGPLETPEVLPESPLPVKFGKPVVRAGRDGKSAWFAFPVMLGYKKVSLRGGRIGLTFSDGEGHAIERELDLAPASG